MIGRKWLGSVVLVGAIVAVAVTLVAWKHISIADAAERAASQPEPVETVAAAVARQHEHRHSATSIGTVVALRSITVRNELPGTVRRVSLVPGQIVEAGTVLVGLDVSVEEAELKAMEAQAQLARTQFARMRYMGEHRAVSEKQVDTARAERDVSLAQIARIEAIIERKTIRAPFRARVGIADVHPGQYLNEGTLLTTLQGVDESAYIDFTVAQQVAESLRPGSTVDIVTAADAKGAKAVIVAIDARVDPVTRNAMVRAKINDAERVPAPGASVRVQVPVGASRPAVTVPASAVRRGPAGDHVFVLAVEQDGTVRAHLRQVQVVAMVGDDMVITQGLAAGERVATSGSFKLHEAALVAIAKPNDVVAHNITTRTGTNANPTI